MVARAGHCTILLEKVKMHGGSLALGQPVEATGARLLIAAMHQLRCSATGVGLLWWQCVRPVGWAAS